MEQHKNHHEMSKPKTVLVTGASGQLGMTFRKFEKNYPQMDFVFKDSKELDITNTISLINTFNEIQPNYCINCAAYTNVEKAEEEPEKAILVNAEAVLAIANLCKEYRTVLIHVSTDYVFDGQKRSPYTVDDIPNPINVYGASKLHGELNIKKTLNQFFIVRTSWVYSKEFGNNFYRSILNKAMSNEELSVVDNQIGCPTETNSLVEFIMKLISSDFPYGVYHFSDSKPISWYGFAKAILKENNITDTKLFKNNNFKTKAKRPNYSVLE